MKDWLRRIRGALGIGVSWAVGWAPVGVVIALIMETLAGLPLGSLVLRWVASVSVLGFIGGSIFSSVLRSLEGHRRFDELSLPRFSAWGALGGLTLGALAIAVGLVGAGFGPGFGVRELLILATSTLLSSASATGTLALARMADDRELLDDAAAVAEVGLREEEVRDLLPG